MDKDKYIRQLEEALRKFLEPVRDIPYKIAIKALTGCEVLTFNPKEKKNQELLKKLIEASQIALKNANKEGIQTKRPNEAGNEMEKFVIPALNEVGLKAEKPKTKGGKTKTAGYPDIEITDKYGRTIYLECKTYSSITKNQTFRTFYFSPSKDPKITKDAFHLLLSFELKRAKRNKKEVFVPISWKLYTLENLKVQVKHEFNASNKDLYKEEYLLAEGKIK
jgi:hypothetical protein